MVPNTHPLSKASLKVLEDWAMMIVEEVLDATVEVFDANQNFYMSWVKLEGVISGAVSIVAQEPFMRCLAHNLLADDENEPTFEDCKDAFKEMSNVLAGNFLTEAYGEDVVFDLISPNVSEVPFEEVERFTKRNIVFTFVADDSPVAITFSINHK